MILGGGSNCQGCGCGGRCPECTRTCQNPRIGDAFQVVGRGFSPEIGDEGAVSGRITDGYLTASGNFDADMNGMSGGGPYYQQVGGTFFLDSVQTRFPCSLTVSFWRNTFTSSDPPASSALTDNRVRITCLAGQFAIQGGTLLLNPGEYYEFVGGIPLSSTGDPRSATGTYGGFATCDNTQVSIHARIEWNVQPRVHILLGIVRECYPQDTGGGGVCSTFCSGSPAPSQMYLTLSGVTTASEVFPTPGGSVSPSMSFMNGTYVISEYQKNYGICDAFIGGFSDGYTVPGVPIIGVVNISFGTGTQWPYATPDGDTWVSGFALPAGTPFGNGYRLVVVCKKGRADVCSSTSGTGSVHVQELPLTNTSRWFIGSCSWTLTP